MYSVCKVTRLPGEWYATWWSCDEWLLCLRLLSANADSTSTEVWRTRQVLPNRRLCGNCTQHFFSSCWVCVCLLDGCKTLRSNFLLREFSTQMKGLLWQSYHQAHVTRHWNDDWRLSCVTRVFPLITPTCLKYIRLGLQSDWLVARPNDTHHHSERQCHFQHCTLNYTDTILKFLTFRIL